MSNYDNSTTMLFHSVGNGLTGPSSSGGLMHWFRHIKIYKIILLILFLLLLLPLFAHYSLLNVSK